MEQEQNNEIYLNLFKFQPSISQRRQIEIMEGALKCYIKVGFDKATFEKVAESAKASRSLVVHYFKSRDDLFEKTMTYVRHSYQMSVIEAIKAAGASPLDQLEAFVRASVGWGESAPVHAKCWLIFLFSCVRNKKHRKMNHEWVQMGQQRIAALLIQVSSSKAISVSEPAYKAREIQRYISGSLITYGTEESEMSPAEFSDDCWNSVLDIIKS